MTRREREHLAWLSMVAVVLAGVGVCRPAGGQVRLPKIFGDHMVLQRQMPIPVWGWAQPGEKVSVTLGTGKAAQTEAGKDGTWQVRLGKQEAGGPVTLTVKGTNTVTCRDVLIGEVWLCSGQSNMQWTVSRSKDSGKEQAAANWPKIRHIAIPRRPSNLSQDDVQAEWTVCSPKTVANYTACGYFFGRYLHKALDVPVGLINSSWGGTRIEPWTPPCGFAGVGELADIYRQVRQSQPAGATQRKVLAAYVKAMAAWKDQAKAALAGKGTMPAPPQRPALLQRPRSHQSPTVLYHGMIHPLVPYAIRGAIWYQGESNHTEGHLYIHKTRALVEGWRKVWQQERLPFLYVQVAPYHYGNESPQVLPVFWEAQAKALAIPDTGMAVIHDIGNLKNIHPTNKQDVGKRLGLIAMAKVYGKAGVVYSGPTCKSMAIEGGTIRVTFDHAGSGLVARDGKPLTWFEIAGADTGFQKADAVIDGHAVVVSSPKVAQPLAVRFAWHKLAEPNLANKEGLPAVPFRAGKVPRRDALKTIDEAKGLALVYDLDLSKLGPTPRYDVDRSGQVGAFDRVAYLLELQRTGGPVQWVYVSMDAFTTDARKIGVPAFSRKAHFQQKVANLNVLSNVGGIVTGNNLAGGNIEFWPNNYGPPNTGKVPGASDKLWDFGDQPSGPVDGYGCMQVHNYQAKQTLLAINKWKHGASADMGIGNSPGRTRDWTFASNAASFEYKRLRVLVREKK